MSILDRIVSKDIKLIFAGDDKYRTYKNGMADDDIAILWNDKYDNEKMLDALKGILEMIKDAKK